MTHDCGQAGCRACSKNQQTGTVTQVYDAAEQGIDADTRWVVVCADHGSVIDAPTLRAAFLSKSNPLDWCDGCRELVYGKEAANG